MHTDEVFDVEFDAPPPHRRRRAGLVILASMVGVIAVVVGLVASADDADGPDVTADADRETDGVVTVRIESAGRVDGLDSLRMPMVASPDDGLVDGQTVTVSAAGFTPNITVAAVQCAGIAGSFGGENDCDVGNYTLDSSSDAGEIAFTVTVRRYVSTSQGQVDCANPGEHQCVIAVANISDYDESATANVWFDAAVDGERRPALVVSKIDGLDDGEMVTVTGSGFPAEASVVVGECVVGGGWSIFGCWEEDARLADVTTDADGGFVVDVAVRRVVFNGGDCVGNVYGCRISARSTLEPFVLGDGTAANPVRVWFDGTTMPSDIERGVAYALNPDRDLVDGESIVLALGNLTQPVECVEEELLDDSGEVLHIVVECSEEPIAEGAVTVAQCVDLAAGEEYCTDAIELAVVDGSAEGEVTLQRFFARTAGGTVDCAEPGRICELRIEGSVFGHVPLRFAADG